MKHEMMLHIEDFVTSVRLLKVPRRQAHVRHMEDIANAFYYSRAPCCVLFV